VFCFVLCCLVLCTPPFTNSALLLLIGRNGAGIQVLTRIVSGGSAAPEGDRGSRSASPRAQVPAAQPVVLHAHPALRSLSRSVLLQQTLACHRSSTPPCTHFCAQKLQHPALWSFPRSSYSCCCSNTGLGVLCCAVLCCVVYCVVLCCAVLHQRFLVHTSAPKSHSADFGLLSFLSA
jgi:hypothetical protein